jgi:hypothetical protein
MEAALWITDRNCRWERKMTPDFVDKWLAQHPDSLSETDQRELRQFAGEVAAVLARRSAAGDRLDEIELSGDDVPTIAVIFHPHWASKIRWSFEWRLWDCTDADCGHSPDLYPLTVMLVDHVGNAVIESLETSPGLPLWQPDAEGVIHVNVMSEAFWGWPQENRALGSPYWNREAGGLVTLDRETRQHSPWIPSEGHAWRGLNP